MKVAIVFAMFLAVALALPQKDVEIVRQDNENGGDGNYNFNYELSDGTKRSESGSLKTVGDVQAQTSEGSYSWTSPEGQLITVRFTADENGYHPIGDHLPK